MSFEIFKFDPQIAAQLDSLDFLTPTPIQEEGIPLILEGKDVMGLARTGTGKTAAYVLPLLQKLLRGKRGVLRALILAPTRELAEQITEVIRSLGAKTHITVLPVYGGVSDKPQIAKLKKGVDMMVACPGRLLDLLGQGAVDFETLDFLVVDEADQMFDMGFSRDIRRIRKHIPGKPQTLMFSATMPPDIRKMAKELLYRPVYVEMDHEEVLENISHVIYPVPQHLKTPLLFAILEQSTPYSVLVFTRTKYRARGLAEKLKKRGFTAAALQGNMSQNQRKNAFQGFKEGKYQILVATDIAARGIDISHITHVINYDMPDTVEAYTHRVGRTGRAEREGDALSFVTGEDRNIVYNLEYNMGQRFQSVTLEGFDYSAPNPSLKNEPQKPGKKAGKNRTRKWDYNDEKMKFRNKGDITRRSRLKKEKAGRKS